MEWKGGSTSEFDGQMNGEADQQLHLLFLLIIVIQWGHTFMQWQAVCGSASLQ